MATLVSVEDFEAEILNAVLDELSNQSDEAKMLFSKQFSIPIKLKLNTEETLRIRELAKKACMDQINCDDFMAWFEQAFMAGIALHCREINGRIIIRTPSGYEDYEDLSQRFPTTWIRDKILRKRKEFNLHKKEGNIGLAKKVLETPIYLFDKEKSLSDYEKKAKELLRQEYIIKILCPPLKSVSNDAFEIAKIITPILVSLFLSGTIQLPLLPPLLSTIAILIAKMGASSLCPKENL